MSWISAKAGEYLETIYSDSEGEAISVKGNRNVRNNNPGNIEYGTFTKNQGAIGTDGRFAIFPDLDTGYKAMGKLLTNGSYKELTLEEAINRYAPSSENDTNSYINYVSKNTGISTDRKMNSLNDEEINSITKTMSKYEGFNTSNLTIKSLRKDISTTISQNQTQTTYIPKFAFPFKDVNNINIYNEKLSSTPKGNYLFTRHGLWHGAPHFYGTNFDSKIQVIADGELVAYRLNSKYLKNSDAQEGKGAYSTGFFLVRHKLEYPKDNKLTFFSLYMHTAKKDAYNIIQNQTNQSNTNYYTVKKGDTLGKIAKEHHTTVDKLRQDNNIADVNKIREGHVLIIKPFPSSQPTQNTPPPQTNPNSNPNFIVENPLFNKVVVLPTPIKIKAGEVIGLMGEYNQQKESDNKVLHLEVFANEEFNTFVQTAQRGDTNLPQSFNWARVIEIDSKDNVSIFENIEVLYENNTNEELQLNQSFKELFNLIDDDQNGQMEPQELVKAAGNPIIKAITNNYIVKHSSEWDKTQNMAEKFKELVNINKNTISNAEKLLKHYENEKERIYNLSFFEECKDKIEGFPKKDKVYVMNVIGLVGAFGVGKFNWMETPLVQLLMKNESKGSYGAYNITGWKDGIVEDKNNKAYESHFKATPEYNIINMTISEIKTAQTTYVGENKKHLFAVGILQMIPNTLVSYLSWIKKYRKIDEKTQLFDKNFQNDMPFYFWDDKRPHIKEYFQGTRTVGDAAYACAMEWASVGVEKGRELKPKYKKDEKGRFIKDEKTKEKIKIPRYAQGGESYYVGDGLNKAHYSVDEITKKLEETKKMVDDAGGYDKLFEEFKNR